MSRTLRSTAKLGNYTSPVFGAQMIGHSGTSILSTYAPLTNTGGSQFTSWKPCEAITYPYWRNDFRSHPTALSSIDNYNFMTIGVLECLRRHFPTH